MNTKAGKNYHVKLAPVSMKPLQTIVVPSNKGTTVAGPCAPIGEVDINFFDNVAMNLLTSLAIPANTLPLFLSYNTFWTSGGCCILGYHSTNNAGNQAYAVAAYSDPGIFSVPIQDIHALSHEIGEWMDDPLIPQGNHRSGVGTCRTGQRLPEQSGNRRPGHGNRVHHDPEWVHVPSGRPGLLPWFARVTPSTSVNGWYTFLNTFLAVQPVCH